MNPVAYLLVSLGLTSVVLTIIFAIAWYSFGRRPYALLWSMAFLFAALQWSLNLSSQKLPLAFESYWMLVSLCSACTLSLSVAAFRMRARLRNRIAWYLVINALELGAIAYFLIVDRHTGLRTAIGPLYATIMMAACIHAIAHPRSVQLAEWGMIASAGIFGLCEAAAAIAILLGGAAGTQESLNLYRAINFLSLPASYTGMGLFTVLILASDMSKEMKTLALTDSLTGVMNLRGFKDAANRALSLRQRTDTPLSVIVCDVDHFKSINDRHGHAAGDICLSEFARHLQRSARGQDLVGRVGGEEFALLLPDTSLDDATSTAERLRSSLAGLAIQHEGKSIQLRASFGVSAATSVHDDVDLLVRRADQALYRAKHEGRDRVSVATPVS
jgi:diguanylate cyclase (GGDEF)-like protein